MSLIGDEIRHIRIARGLSCREQARQGGVHHATLLRWESGVSTPSYSALAEYLRLLNLPRTELVRILDLLQSTRGVDVLANPCLTPPVGTPTRGDLIRTARRRAGISQAEIAAQMKVTQGTVSKWESGASWLEEERLPELCNVLPLSPDEVSALLSPNLAWKGLGEADLDACIESYVAYCSQCTVHDRDDAELWALALTHRLHEIARTDPGALRPLSWLYASRSYGLLVRGRNREVVAVARQAISIGKEIGFDLTSGYAYWAMARAQIELATGNADSISRVSRISKAANSTLSRVNSPYAGYIDGLLWSLRGDFEVADEHIKQTAIPLHIPNDGGLFSSLSEAYWYGMAQTIRPMLALKTKQWERALDDPSRDLKELPLLCLITKSYQVAAATQLSPKVPEREIQALHKEADSLDLGFALQSILTHIRSLGVKLPTLA